MSRWRINTIVYIANVLLYMFNTTAVVSFPDIYPPCIPVLGVSILADPVDFTPRLFKSIDYCIKQLVIYHGYSLNLTDALAPFVSNKYVQNLTVIESPHFLFSVSEGWNTILKAFPTAPWVCICAYDIYFRPKQLEKISIRFWRELNFNSDPFRMLQSRSLFSFVGWENMDLQKGAYNMFMMSQEVIQVVGYFDENYFPAFYEDNDWSLRMKLGNVRVMVMEDIQIWHGEGSSNTLALPAVTPFGNKSSNNTIKAQPKLEKKYFSGTHFLLHVFPYWDDIRRGGIRYNRQYFHLKWNCTNKRVGDTFDLSDCSSTTPFQATNTLRNISYWEKNTSRINKIRDCIERPIRTVHNISRISTKRGLYLRIMKVRHRSAMRNPNCPAYVKY